MSLRSDGYRPPYDRSASQISSKEVTDFHQKSDADSSATAIHHTLGPRNGQASPGDHRHDGKSSQLILKGTTITGSRGGNAAVASIISALVKLGATDATTP